MSDNIWVQPVQPVTSVTVASTKITINAPAVAGMRVFLIAASFTTDLAGAFDCQDNTTSKFQIKTEIRTTTRDGTIFSPSLPMPISSTGVAANFVLDTTTTGRLSVCYGYGL